MRVHLQKFVSILVFFFFSNHVFCVCNLGDINPTSVVFRGYLDILLLFFEENINQTGVDVFIYIMAFTTAVFADELSICSKGVKDNLIINQVSTVIFPKNVFLEFTLHWQTVL